MRSSQFETSETANAGHSIQTSELAQSAPQSSPTQPTRSLSSLPHTPYILSSPNAPTPRPLPAQCPAPGLPPLTLLVALLLFSTHLRAISLWPLLVQPRGQEMPRPLPGLCHFLGLTAVLQPFRSLFYETCKLLEGRNHIYFKHFMTYTPSKVPCFVGTCNKWWLFGK